jgi:hypothetical protein
MAFSSAITIKSVFGNKRVHIGTYTTSSSETGGDINTGLRSCEFIVLQQTASAVTADAPVINETLPCDGSAVTIVQTASADGYWMAIGY